MVKFIDLTGQKFGRLTVLKTFRRNNKTYCEYQCDCGNIKTIYYYSLKKGNTKSCGCYNKELVSTLNRKHGLRQTRLYLIYYRMVSRCYNKNNNRYKNYGGRGITICDEWIHDFKAFYDWAMANGYQDNLTIDRIDVNGKYEPNNCRWATAKEQSNNKTNNKYIIINGVNKTLSQWLDFYKLNSTTYYQRLQRGWAVEKALITPTRKIKKRGN